eukprot:12253420-Prorocentrum_lima.AAC.1
MRPAPLTCDTAAAQPVQRDHHAVQGNCFRCRLSVTAGWQAWVGMCPGLEGADVQIATDLPVPLSDDEGL